MIDEKTNISLAYIDFNWRGSGMVETEERTSVVVT